LFSKCNYRSCETFCFGLFCSFCCLSTPFASRKLNAPSRCCAVSDNAVPKEYDTHNRRGSRHVVSTTIDVIECHRNYSLSLSRSVERGIFVILAARCLGILGQGEGAALMSVTVKFPRRVQNASAGGGRAPDGTEPEHTHRHNCTLLLRLYVLPNTNTSARTQIACTHANAQTRTQKCTHARLHACTHIRPHARTQHSHNTKNTQTHDTQAQTHTTSRQM